ncbi:MULTISPECIES: hypothetical protein [Mycolicibacter]|uniref:Uncharacterized protein n=2 Tax=Mycolicibacter TaxID=1073531 RepID=A0ABU5XLF2_9MYCO|nr:MULTISPECIES: hypothetical protein [unclassified Mycolicibacter]MEB3023029.1 hypothetical protein [Mycolicibacter sp. MYC098]MEB3033539.1 hypothetical protein [Mycolicibacter sp. MYC340]
MRMSVMFTSVYDGAEQVRTDALDVEPPGVTEDEVAEWADEHLRPRTGEGNLTSRNPGYFAEIIECADRPDLVGREFTWGV